MLNLTPHVIRIQVAQDEHSEKYVEIQPSGQVARVEVVYDDQGTITVNGVEVAVKAKRTLSRVTGLPTDGTPCLVSSMVLDHVAPGTRGVYAPNTGPSAVRDKNGQIWAVTQLISA